MNKILRGGQEREREDQPQDRHIAPSNVVLLQGDVFYLALIERWCVLIELRHSQGSLKEMSEKINRKTGKEREKKKKMKHTRETTIQLKNIINIHNPGSSTPPNGLFFFLC